MLHHRRRVTVMTAFVMVLAAMSGPTLSVPASAQSVATSLCKIDRQAPFENAPVSVGFPVHPDRLAELTRVNILVARFELADVPYPRDRTDYTARDLATSAFVSRMSRGKVELNFTYAPTLYPHRRTLAQWEQLKANQHTAYGNGDEANSTFGFVREAIAALDPTVDFSDIDSVVLQGPFTGNTPQDQKTAVYEAFMVRSEATGFFRPFATSEGGIHNAFVMSGSLPWLVYAHELLHNFGLTDLYDSTNQVPPAEINGWSLFSSTNPTLYYWERWQLGWLRDEEVICFDLRDKPTLTPQDVTLDFNATQAAKMVVIRTHDTRALVIELREPMTAEHYANSTGMGSPRLSGQALVTYSVQSDRWPSPIRLVNQPAQTSTDDFTVGVTRSLETYRVHVIDASSGMARIGVWSADQEQEARAVTLRAAAQTVLEQRRQAAEEAQRRAEAEAKAAAEAGKKPVVVTAKKRTITCVKGTQTRKIRAVKPTCPAGWRKR